MMEAGSDRGAVLSRSFEPVEQQEDCVVSKTNSNRQVYT
jgi:hypothetical protein